MFEGSIGVRPGKFLKNMSRLAQDIERHAAALGGDLRREAPDATIGARIQTQIEQRLLHFREHGSFEI